MFDFFNLYQCPFSPHYWDTLHHTYSYYDRIKDAFSQDFFDEFLQAHDTLPQMDRDESYRAGFQDGVLFMTRSLLSLPKTPGP